MPTHDIERLLKKYQEDTISTEELAVLETWYLNWSPKGQEVSEDELYEAKARVWQALRDKPKTGRIVLWKWISAIASVFFLTFISWNIYYKPTLKKQSQFVKQEVRDYKPGINKAILKLSNGEQVFLNDTEGKNIATEGSVVISNDKDGRLVYKYNVAGETTKAVEIMNTMSTPRGGEYQLLLSDGTKVWLNAASSITYPVNFNGATREVAITGEAYFEVAHNVKKPFIVSAANQKITVLGTRFNVSSYQDEEATKTALISGSIKIQNIKSGLSKVIMPGTGTSISVNGADIQQFVISADDVLAWKNGYFVFDNMDVSTMMKVLSRWYDVDVEYLNGNSTERFGGTFSKKRNLSETLKNIEKIGKVHFTLKTGKIIVKN